MRAAERTTFSKIHSLSFRDDADRDGYASEVAPRREDPAHGRDRGEQREERERAEHEEPRARAAGPHARTDGQQAEQKREERAAECDESEPRAFREHGESRAAGRFAHDVIDVPPAIREVFIEKMITKS